jgi:8-oxo-dGTP diphosphatase
VSAARAAILAAGVVVHDQAGRVALVHRPRYDDWSLPKGKLERGEAAAVAAVRECWEETGIHARLEAPLTEVTYSVAKGRKRVRYWRAAIADDDGFAPGPEVDQLRWTAPSEAAQVLTNASDAAVVAASTGLGPTRALVALRHAEAVPRAEWAESSTRADDERPLTARGLAQAQDVAILLACYRPQHLVSSPARRCEQTIEPLAALVAAVIKRDDRYSEARSARDPDALRAAVGALAVPPLSAVLCTHRPVLPLVVSTLVAAARAGSGEHPAATTPVAGLLAAERPLQPASCLVLHRDDAGRLVSYERHQVTGRA